MNAKDCKYSHSPKRCGRLHAHLSPRITPGEWSIHRTIRHVQKGTQRTPSLSNTVFEQLRGRNHLSYATIVSFVGFHGRGGMKPVFGPNGGQVRGIALMHVRVQPPQIIGLVSQRRKEVSAHKHGRGDALRESRPRFKPFLRTGAGR